MASEDTKASATPHSLIRSGAFLLFAFTLVVIFLLRQPKDNKEIGEGKATQTAEKVENEKSFGQRFSSDPINILTTGLLIVGAAQAGLFVWQLSLIRKSLADTKKAAKAAKRQAGLAKESLIASHRAWIKVEARLCQFHIADQCVILTCFVSGVNTGFSPSIMTNIIFDEYDAIGVYDNAQTVFSKLLEKKSIMRFPGGVVFPSERTHEAGILIRIPLADFNSTMIRRIIVGIFYTIAGDSEERITINTFDLFIKKNIVSEPTIDGFALSGSIIGFAT